MTAIRGLDHDGMLQGLREAEAFSDLDQMENAMVPLEEITIETPDDVTIDAARAGITLLVRVIEDIKNGRTAVFTLAEIGEALIGKPVIERSDTPLLSVIFERDREIRKLKEGIAALERIAERHSKVPANWYFQLDRAKRNEKLMRAASRSMFCAMSTLDNDLYATRVKNCRAILQDAYDELDGEGYGFEGDEANS